MDIIGQTSIQLILFFILYGVTGVVPLIASVYLLLRRGNAFAPGVTPPVRLRRWAAAFFAVAALGHVWWCLFYIYSSDLQSASYVVIGVLDCVALLTTIAGTLLAMLQDRKRPVWPAFAAMIPFVALGGLQILIPETSFMGIATIYILSIYVLFSLYMVFAVRQYGHWLNDNYADLENKKVWLSQTVSMVCLLLFILYVLVADIVLMYFLHVIELVLFGLLLWRVETLPLLGSTSTEETSTVSEPETSNLSSPPSPPIINIDLVQIEQLLAKHCVDTQLYLQHDLTLQQLAQAVGTNRSYLSQYFSRQSITYNTYINNLRINHFICRYQELAAAGQPVVAQELAQESGFRSYSTFGRAFMQRMGQSVTAWMRGTEG
jgi:AraC-like DNA-binding protein